MKNMNISPQTPIQDMTAGQLISCMAITVMTIVIGYAIAQLIIGLAKAFFSNIKDSAITKLMNTKGN